VVLDEEGDVYPCEILAARMGNVRDGSYDLKGILSSSEGRKTLDAIGRGNCYCTHECNFMMNIFFNPRLYPALFREYGRLLLGGAFRGA
jgi:MoaA/NifB/PqqE/SkfB family radical SAM enzyme